MPPRWIRWTAVTLFWTLDGVVSALGSNASGAAFGHEMLVDVAVGVLWVPYTMGAFALSNRFPVERGRLAVGLAVQAAAAAFVVVTRPVLYLALDPWVHWYGPPPGFARLLQGSVRYNVFLFALISGAVHAVYFAVRARERERQAERLEAQLARARLDLLRTQLQPHFLYNALGGIAELVHRDPHAADRMIVRLCRLLRIALDQRDEHIVTLSHELSCLAPYVELEKMRYGERLTVIEDVEPAARDARVPALLLQPIVENAIRHGIAPRSTPGTVTIRARRAHAIVELEIVDDGVGLAPGFASGIGLRNTRARLAELYGEAWALELEAAAGSGTRVRIRVPQRGEAG